MNMFKLIPTANFVLHKLKHPLGVFAQSLNHHKVVMQWLASSSMSVFSMKRIQINNSTHSRNLPEPENTLAAPASKSRMGKQNICENQCMCKPFKF